MHDCLEGYLYQCVEKKTEAEIYIYVRKENVCHVKIKRNNKKRCF